MSYRRPSRKREPAACSTSTEPHHGQRIDSGPTRAAGAGTQHRPGRQPARRDASWAGICPGNNASGGKGRPGRTRPVSRWLKQALTEAAWGAARTKGTYPAAHHAQIKGRAGGFKAIGAHPARHHHRLLAHRPRPGALPGFGRRLGPPPILARTPGPTSHRPTEDLGLLPIVPGFRTGDSVRLQPGGAPLRSGGTPPGPGAPPRPHGAARTGRRPVIPRTAT
ncbi:transposase [Streptomyces sp. NPDC055722]